MLGHSNREELMALNIDTELYVSVEQRDAFRREVELHNYVRNFEVTLRRKDGVLLTAMESSFATRDASGRIERYQGFLLDMNVKKRAADEIRRRNRELNALNAMAVIATQSFDLDEILNLTLRQVISLLGAETGSIYLSDSDEKTFRRRAGWGQRSAERARFSEVKFPDGFGDLVTRSRTEVITAEYLPHLPPLVAEFIRADGLLSWIWVLLWGKDGPMGIMGISSRETREYTSNDENLLVAIGRQLSTTIEKVRLYEETCRAYEDLRHTQEQLLQSEKMSAIGQLIAGVAHDLNNPLASVVGFSDLLAEAADLPPRLAEPLAVIRQEAERASSIVRNLLSFARRQEGERQLQSIRPILESTHQLLKNQLLAARIELTLTFEPGLPEVEVHANQIKQVFVNIINNAAQAISSTRARERGGRIEIATRCEPDGLSVNISDNGPGIPEAVAQRVFEPFFSTKSEGEGTGLGLSISLGIVKEHGGNISVDPGGAGSGRGATFTVELPTGVHAELSPLARGTESEPAPAERP